jgi:hypothetical protein
MSSMEPSPRKGLATAVVTTGLLAGTLDILSACTHAYLARGTTPDTVFKYIASALLGMEAFAGGTGTILLGLLMHYAIAFSWTLLFFLIYPKLPFLWRNRIVSGIIYGAFVWVIMSLVLVPLTDVPKGPFNPTSAAIGMIILMLMIGMPNAFRAQAFYGPPPSR